MQDKVTMVMNYLNENKTRCTYNAAAEAIGITTHALKKDLGEPRAEASWFVNQTSGDPTKYTDNDKHAELYRTTRIITSGKVLKRNLDL